MARSLPRPWARVPVAIDLGTARTRIQLSQRGVSVEVPSVLASDGTSGPYLAGWEAWAWEAGQRYADEAPLRLVWPLHAGMVTNTPACTRLVRLLWRSARRRPGRRAEVLLGIPAGAGSREREAAVTAVSEATGARVRTIEEPFAAAVGAGLDVQATPARLLVDIGAGVTEVVAVGAGRVLQARSVPRGASAFTPSLGAPSRTPPDSPLPRTGGDTLDRLAAAVTELLASLAPRQRAAAAEHGVVLTGGGALVPGLAAQLSAAVGLAVTTASGPAHATIDGLVESLGTADSRPPGRGGPPAALSDRRARMPAR